MSLFYFLTFFLLKFSFCLVKPLHKNDIYALDIQNSEINRETPFLVFIYFQKSDFVCPLCEEFRNSLENLPIVVRTLNFADNVDLGSRFLQHTFPAFVLRYKNMSYVINPSSIEDLRNVIEKELWREYKPVRKFRDVDSTFAYLFGKINCVVFFVVTNIQRLSLVIPEYYVTVFILCVISFLIYSIVDVLRTPDVKYKKE